MSPMLGLLPSSQRLRILFSIGTWWFIANPYSTVFTNLDTSSTSGFLALNVSLVARNIIGNMVWNFSRKIGFLVDFSNIHQFLHTWFSFSSNLTDST